jgi:hypothetical protein
MLIICLSYHSVVYHHYIALLQTNEERKLQGKNVTIEGLEEQAFNILVDLGTVDLNPDPDEVTLDSEDDYVLK